MTLDFDAIYILNTLGLLNEGFDKLTPNRPVIHTCLTYPKLNMDDFSILACPL